MNKEAKAPQLIVQVVCDGVYLYGLCSDNTLWFSALQFPLSWTQLPAVPNNEIISQIGVSFGAVKNLPDEVFFALTQKTDILYFWDGIGWTQRWP